MNIKEDLHNIKIKNPNCINKCSICLKLYANKTSLKRHESVVCQQRFECSNCNKNYKSKYHLRYHYNECINGKRNDEYIGDSEIYEQKNDPSLKNILTNVDKTNLLLWI